MAMGQNQRGGLAAMPDLPELGPATWSELSGMDPGHPLVGGRGPYGNVDADYHLRQVAIAHGRPQPMPGAEAVQASWRELGDLKHNPLPWVLIAAVLYLGLFHVHVSGGVGFGRKHRK